MSSFYAILEENITQTQVLEKAIDLFFTLEEDAKEAFLARVRAKHGEESYDLLKNYSIGLRGFPMVYKRQVLENILPFIPVKEAFELVRMECRAILQPTIPFSSNDRIQTTIDFTKPFLKFVKNAVYHKVTASVMSKCSGYEADIALVYSVEKFLLLQKLYSFYQDLHSDIQFIWDNLINKTKNAEETILYIPTWQISLCMSDYQYHDEETETSEWKKHFEPSELLCVSGEMHKIAQESTLPAIEGIFKEYLVDQITQHNLQQNYQQQSASNAYAVAEYDIQNILANYPKNKRYGKKIKFNSTLQLSVGELKSTLGTSVVYKRKLETFLAGIFIHAFIWAILIWSAMENEDERKNLWLVCIIGVFFLIPIFYKLFQGDKAGEEKE